MHHQNIASVCCHILAATAAYHKQCAYIPYCHLCTHWHYFSCVTFSLLCMHHVSRVNFPQSCNNRNTIQHPHAVGLAFAFLKNYVLGAIISYSCYLVTNCGHAPFEQCICLLPHLASAAAYYKQCAFISYCHLCIH